MVLPSLMKSGGVVRSPGDDQLTKILSTRIEFDASVKSFSHRVPSRDSHEVRLTETRRRTSLAMDFEGLLARHAPCFYLPLHLDPFARPTSFDHLLESASSLRCARSGRILRDGGISHDDIGSLLRDPAVEQVRLDVSARARLGELRVHIDDVPIYASVKAIPGEVEAWELTYVTLFAYNGPYFGGIGAHDGDIEHISVRVDGAGLATGVWFNAHRSVDGMWVAAQDATLDEVSGRIASYVAASGHGHYPSQGRWWRHFGLGNDICRRDVRWCPKTVVWIDPITHSVPCPGHNSELAGRGARHINPSAPAYVDASGTRRYLVDKRFQFWGEAAGLAHQPWFRETGESPRSRTSIERIFTVPFHFFHK